MQHAVHRLPRDARDRGRDDPEPRDAQEAGPTTASPVVDGTGPFTLDTYQPGIEVVVNRWDKYPGSGIPYVKTRARRTSTASTGCRSSRSASAPNEIESGSVMAVKNPAPQDVDRLKGNPDLVVVEFPALASYWISPNHHATDLGFDDLRVRQAMSHAIDRPGLAKSLFFGHAARRPTARSRRTASGTTRRVEQFNQYDPDKAKSAARRGRLEGRLGRHPREERQEALLDAHLRQRPADHLAGHRRGRSSPMLQKVGMRHEGEGRSTTPAFDAARVRGKKPPASWGYEWLWSSPIDLLVYLLRRARPTSTTARCPRSTAAVEAWQIGRNVEELRPRPQAAAARLGAAAAEDPDRRPATTSGSCNKKVMGYQPSQTHALPALQRRLDQRVVPTGPRPSRGRAGARAGDTMAHFVLRRFALLRCCCCSSRRCSSSTGCVWRPGDIVTAIASPTTTRVVISQPEPAARARQAAGRRSTSSSSATC